MKPGIYRDMDSATYFGDPCDEPSLSQSIAKILIEQSPLHAFQAHPRLAVQTADEDDEPEKYEKAKAIGNAAHAIVIRRGKKLAIIDAPNFKTKTAQTDKQAAILAGAEPILRKHYNAAQMAQATSDQLKRIPGCERAFTDGERRSRDRQLRGRHLAAQHDRLDHAGPARGMGSKTSGMSASPYATGKQMASAGWHIQAAMHERILDALDPQGAGRRPLLLRLPGKRAVRADRQRDRRGCADHRPQADRLRRQDVGALPDQKRSGPPIRSASSGPNFRHGRKMHGWIARSPNMRPSRPLARAPISNPKHLMAG
jgi:hypothetical protein